MKTHHNLMPLCEDVQLCLPSGALLSRSIVVVAPMKLSILNRERYYKSVRVLRQYMNPTMDNEGLQFRGGGSAHMDNNNPRPPTAADRKVPAKLCPWMIIVICNYLCVYMNIVYGISIPATTYLRSSQSISNVEFVRINMKLLFVPDNAPNPVKRQVINRHILKYVKARNERRSKAKMLSRRAWLATLDVLRLEPWASITQLLDPLAREIFHYSVTIFWPGFDPGAERHEVANAWAPVALQEPALFNALMRAAILHIQTRRRATIFDLAMLGYHNRTIELLRIELSQSACSLRDGIIMAILFLQVDDNSGTTKQNLGDDIFVAFRSLQWLDDYSCLPFVEVHRAALVKIISARGLDCLEVNGLGSLLQYFDIISSTINLTKPALPLCKLYRTVQQSETRLTAFGHHTGTVDVSANKTEPALIRLVDNFGLGYHYVDLILDLRTLCILFDVYLSGKSNSSNLSRLALHRNLIHYRLLSTVDEAELSDYWLRPRVTDLVRSSLLVFTICVAFPVVCQNPLERLLKEMKQAIESFAGWFEDEDLGQLCTWCCMLGAIGSATTGHDSSGHWFEEQLVVIELAKAESSGFGTPLCTYSDVKAVLQRHLWYGTSCDTQASLVWQRVSAKVLQSFAK
jgi:hypothetical protein